MITFGMVLSIILLALIIARMVQGYKSGLISVAAYHILIIAWVVIIPFTTLVFEFIAGKIGVVGWIANLMNSGLETVFSHAGDNSVKQLNGIMIPISMKDMIREKMVQTGSSLSMTLSILIASALVKVIVFILVVEIAKFVYKNFIKVNGAVNRANGLSVVNRIAGMMFNMIFCLIILWILLFLTKLIPDNTTADSEVSNLIRNTPVLRVLEQYNPLKGYLL